MCKKSAFWREDCPRAVKISINKGVCFLSLGTVKVPIMVNKNVR